MAFSRALTPASTPEPDALTSAMVGISLVFAAHAASEPNIEDTLLFASAEAMDRDTPGTWLTSRSTYRGRPLPTSRASASSVVRWSLTAWVIWVASVLVSVGMWTERFVIVVSPLSQDYLPSSWGFFRPTWVDWSLLAGTLGFFLMAFMLFLKLVPPVPIKAVGERAWRPFERAWRHMRMCQSRLDSSPSQLYRVAARHRRRAPVERACPPCEYWCGWEQPWWPRAVPR